nr:MULTISPECIES: hypothetical protein [Paracoccus]
MIRGKLLRRLDQPSPDAVPLLIAVDRNFPNVEGVGRYLSVQESRNSITLHLRDEGKAICDQGAMLFLGLNSVIGDPLKPRRLPEYFAGTAFDLWQEGSITVACGSDAYHAHRIAAGPITDKGCNKD